MAWGPMLYGGLHDLARYAREGGDELFGEDFKGFAVGHLLELLGSLVTRVDPQEALARALLDLLGEGEGGIGHRDDLLADDRYSPDAFAEEALRVLAEEETGGGHGAEVDLGKDIALPLGHILDDGRHEGAGNGDYAASGCNGLTLACVIVADADGAVFVDYLVDDCRGLGLVLDLVPEGLGQLPGAAINVIFGLREVKEGVDGLEGGYLVGGDGVGALGEGVPDGADIGVIGTHKAFEGLAGELLGLLVIGVGLLVDKLAVSAADSEDFEAHLHLFEERYWQSPEEQRLTQGLGFEGGGDELAFHVHGHSGLGDESLFDADFPGELCRFAVVAEDDLGTGVVNVFAHLAGDVRPPHTSSFSRTRMFLSLSR